jgi:hypothetical protein
LIARQGEVREAHFAHASRHAFETTQDKCDYSLFVAARLMARQLIGEQLELELPAYEDCIRDQKPGFSDIEERFTVTESRRITLEDVHVETIFDMTSVDIVGKLAAYSFVVYLTHPGRSVPEALYSPEDRRCGIIEIRLHGIGDAFARGRALGESYREVLSNALVEDVNSKRWIFHPVYERAAEEAKKAIETRRLRERQHQPPRSTTLPVRAESTSVLPPKQLAEYKCVLCRTVWETWHPAGIVDCPACNGRLCGRLHRLI